MEVAAGIGRRDRLEVGALHRLAIGEGERPHQHRQVEPHRPDGRQRLPLAALEQHRRLLARQVPGGREFLAQPVVGGMRDRRVRKVGAPESIVPGRAQRKRLLAEALLEDLVDVERRDLELRNLARDTRVMGEEQAPPLSAPEAPEAGFVDPRAGEQERQQTPRARALGECPSARVDDQLEQVLPQLEPADEALGLERSTLAVALRQACSVGALRGWRCVAHERGRPDPRRRGRQVRKLARQPFDPDAHRGSCRSNSSSATNQSRVGASITRNVCPPFLWFAGQTSTQVPQPMQRSCRVVIQRASEPSNSRFARVGHTATQAPQWMQVAAGPASFSERSTK